MPSALAEDDGRRANLAPTAAIRLRTNVKVKLNVLAKIK